MPKCRKCGTITDRGMRICYVCLDRWKEQRIKAYNKTVEKFGLMTKDNQKEFREYMRAVEKAVKGE